MLQLSHRPKAGALLSQRLRLRRRVRQRLLMLQLSHRPKAGALLSQRQSRDRRGDRVIVGKDAHVAVAVAAGEGDASLADKVSTITVKKNLRPNFQTIPNNSKQNHVL